MNCLCNRNATVLSHPYENDPGIAGCPSRIYFSETPYTLSVGQLFSGNFNGCQSCAYQRPKCAWKVNEAMKSVRRTIDNRSIPSVPYCYNSMMNNSNQNHIAQAAVLLEQAANVMSMAMTRADPYGF